MSSSEFVYCDSGRRASTNDPGNNKHRMKRESGKGLEKPHGIGSSELQPCLLIEKEDKASMQEKNHKRSIQRLTEPSRRPRYEPREMKEITVHCESHGDFYEV